MTVNLKCDKMFDNICRFGEVTRKFCYTHVFLEKFANVRQNMILKHWSHQIVRFKNRRICKNLILCLHFIHDYLQDLCCD